jgi:hypothetical protein
MESDLLVRCQPRTKLVESFGGPPDSQGRRRINPLVKQHQRRRAVIGMPMGHEDVCDFRQIHAMVRACCRDAGTGVEENDVIDQRTAVDSNDAMHALALA